MNQPAGTAISVVCVYNDPIVRRECLDRSLRGYLGTSDSSPRVEYIPVENASGAYKSAGAALNYGASVATSDVIVFVHQDVFLHSIEAIIRAARELERGHFGVLGATGIRADGRIVGSVRDRTVLVGEPVAEPADVDSVDELLFMVPRRIVVCERLTESPAMAWHAYAVEYGLRLRRLGLRVGVTHIPVTHNSLATNRAGLDVAHARVAARYRDMLPVRTTCGVLTRKTVTGSHRNWLAMQNSRLRRGAAFVCAAQNVQGYSNAPFVYADIRFGIDEIIGRAPGRRLWIINNTRDQRFNDDEGPVELKRLGNSVLLSARQASDLPLIADHCPRDAWLLVTNMAPHDIGVVAASFARRDHIVGFHASIGYWMLVGAGLADLPASWRRWHLPLRRHRRSSWPLGATCGGN
jgi:hypothetical protein